MAFGRKNAAGRADTIFIGGHIATMDEDRPFAEAVAVCDGRIAAVGGYETMSDLEDDDTEIIDLEGKYVTPGFIEAESSPVRDAFDEELCLPLFADSSLEDVLRDIAEYVEDAPEKDSYFAYGFGNDLLGDDTYEERCAVLDEIEDAKPLAALSDDGRSIWFNTPYRMAIEAAAEEDEVNIITFPYILSIIDPFSAEDAGEAVAAVTQGYCEEGYTEVLETSAPGYLTGIYKSMVARTASEGALLCRFDDSVRVAREIGEAAVSAELEERRTFCVEMDGALNCDLLTVEIHDTEDGTYPSPAYLDEICRAAMSRGFGLCIKATGHNAVIESYAVISDLRSRFSELPIILVHNENIGREERNMILSGEYFIEVAPETEASTALGEIRRRTTYAAERAGIDEDRGTIEIGKSADFAIFDTDPLKGGPSLPACVMTVIGGNIAYDLDAENMDFMYDILSHVPAGEF